MIVGIIIPTIEPQFQNLYTNTLLTGVQERLAEIGYSMLFFPSTASSSMEIVREQLNRSAGCDGYLLFSTGFCPLRDIHRNIAELEETGKPYVTLNVPEVDFNVNQVLIEDLGTARGVRYLMERGHRNVVLLLGRRNGEHARLILDDYRSVLADFDLPYDNDYILYGSYDADAGYAAVLRFLSSKRPLTAVCCMSDTMAVGAAHALRDSGLRVPRDVSLIGRNDIAAAKHLDPPLTTIDLKIQSAGRIAAELLLSNLAKDLPPRKISIPGVVIDRGSVNEVRSDAR